MVRTVTESITLTTLRHGKSLPAIVIMLDKMKHHYP